MSFDARNEQFRAKSSQNVTPVGSIVLNLPPSCIEFVPVSETTKWAADNPLFVVGTYDLQKEERDADDKEKEELKEEAIAVPKEQSRQGSLTLYVLRDDVLTELQTFPTPSAILDLHFFPGTAIFAVASSTGTITIFEVQQAGSNNVVANEDQTSSSLGYEIKSIASHQVLDEDNIITYFAWDLNSTLSSPRMAITSTTGAVMILTFESSFSEFQFEMDGEAVSSHDYEAWCCALSEDSKTIYSGGDDSKLIMSSLDPAVPMTRKLRYHDAGVTMILPIPKAAQSTEHEGLLITGSYDDFIRVYQPPSQYNTKPRILAEKDIGDGGGGVWRLKFLSCDFSDSHLTQGEITIRRTYVVLASCMRVGCKILRLSESQTGEWMIDVVAHTAIHESMNYASDVLPLEFGDLEGVESKRTIVSTSFYDRLLFVWKYDPSTIIN